MTRLHLPCVYKGSGSAEEHRLAQGPVKGRNWVGRYTYR